MKHFSKLLLLVALIAGALSACDSSKGNVSAIVKSMQNKLPVDFDIYGRIDDIKYDKSTNVVEVTWFPVYEFANVDSLAADDALAKDYFYKSFQNEKLQKLVAAAIEADAGINVKYYPDMEQKSEAVVALTAADLEAAAAMPIMSADAKYAPMLKAYADWYIAGGTGFPALIDDNFKMTDSNIDESTVTMTFTLNDPSHMAYLKSIGNLEKIFRFRLKDAAKSDLRFHQMLKMVDDMNCGMKIRFVGASAADAIEYEITAPDVHMFASMM